MELVTLFGTEEAGYTIDPAAQQVDNPERAVQKFPSEALAAAIKNLGLFIVAVVGLPIIGVVSHLIDRSIKGDPFPGHIIAIICFILTPIALIWFLGRAIKAFRIACAEPKRQTAEGTVRTFLEAIDYKLWNRAYNCLTDSAQKVGVVELPREDYLQRMMPSRVRIESLEWFKGFWSRIEFSIEPRWTSMRSEPVDAQTTKVIVPVHARWTVTHFTKNYDSDYETRDEVLECPFLAINRGNSWFLANGFIWPSGRKYLIQATD